MAYRTGMNGIGSHRHFKVTHDQGAVLLVRISMLDFLANSTGRFCGALAMLSTGNWGEVNDTHPEA
jgi:hypothetical protein